MYDDTCLGVFLCPPVDRVWRVPSDVPPTDRLCVARWIIMQVGDDFVRQLAHTLRTHPALASLNLKRCSLRNTAGHALAQLVQACPTLTALALSYNEIRCDGMALACAFLVFGSLLLFSFGKGRKLGDGTMCGPSWVLVGVGACIHDCVW
jgi:hypothetical protein